MRQAKTGYKIVIEHPQGFEIDGKIFSSEDFRKLQKLMKGTFWLIIKPDFND